MKHYKDAQNNVYAYEADGSQDSFILPGLTPITPAQADALRIGAIPQPTPTQQIEALEREQSAASLASLSALVLQLAEKDAASDGVNPAQLRQANLAYRQLKELREQVAEIKGRK